MPDMLSSKHLGADHGAMRDNKPDKSGLICFDNDTFPALISSRGR